MVMNSKEEDVKVRSYHQLSQGLFSLAHHGCAGSRFVPEVVSVSLLVGK